MFKKNFFVLLFLLFLPLTLFGQKKLVLAIDGFSFEAFKESQKQGLFLQFKGSTPHVSPYPSMTEVSWTEMMHGKDLFPVKGDVRSVESTYFDVDTLQTQNDPRNLFLRYSKPFSFFSTFDTFLNPMVETLIYLDLEGEPIINQELKDLEEDIKTHFTGEHFIAYVSSVDAVAHTRKNGLYPLLRQIDALQKRVERHFESKGIALETWIVSDHGNVGRFKEGGEEGPLISFDIEKAVEKTGFHLKNKEKLTSSFDMAIPIMALGNYAGVYFYDLSQRELFAKKFLEEEAVELITYVDASKKTIVMGKEGQLAYIMPDGRYENISGNPLHIDASGKSQIYPDALFRLTQVAHKQVQTEPDMIVNLKEDYCLKGSFSNIVSMVRTHGSLAQKSSLGVLAVSNNSQKEKALLQTEMIRTQDILTFIGISPKEAFHDSHHFFHEDPHQSIETAPKDIVTTKELSGKTLFLRGAKLISQTVTYSSLPHLEETLTFLQNLYDEYRTKPLSLENSINKKELPLPELKALLSELLSNPVEKGEGVLKKALNLYFPSDAQGEIDQVEYKVGMILSLIRDLYTLPYTIDKLLLIGEENIVADRRDRSVARSWYDQDKKDYLNTPHFFEENPEKIQTLFKEIYKEKKTLDEVYPTSFPLFYNPKAKNVTIVYVPGIYNEIFGQEIFNEGLASLRENFGVRILYADVDGRCQSHYNGKALLQFLKEDLQKQLSRGYEDPYYFILGYSKGGLDALYALLEDRSFTHRYIRGLLTIGSPLQGTSLGPESDLLQSKMHLVGRKLPSACEIFSPSLELSADERSKFFQTHQKELIGLTKFYSLAFSSMVNFDGFTSNFIMDAMKLIYKLPEAHDALVTVANAQFPKTIPSLHLGSLSGHHLSGLRSSHLQQAPLMEAIMTLLLELKSFDRVTLKNWYKDLQTTSSDRGERLLAHKRLLMSKTLSFSSHSSKKTASWFEDIKQSDNKLHTSLECQDIIYLNTLYEKYQKDALYKTKPFFFSCPFNHLTLNITLEEGSWWPWKQAVTKTIIIKNWDQFLETLLKEAMLSLNIHEEHKEAKTFISSHTPLQLPPHHIEWSLDKRLDLKKDAKILADPDLVAPFKGSEVEKISLICDHESIKKWRQEYLFSYETASPPTLEIDDQEKGYSMVFDQALSSPVCKMPTTRNSTRVTTGAIRFKVGDFSHLSLMLKSEINPIGANPILGEDGEDRSPFQLWLTLAPPGATSQNIKLFGFYWGEESLVAQHPYGTVTENKWSNRSYVIFTLPEAFQTFLTTPNGAPTLHKWHTFNFNLEELLSKSFPKDGDIKDWQVVAVTLQTDSRKLPQDSLVYLKNIEFSRN